MTRDELTEAREKLLNTVVTFFRRDSSVLGILLGGSLPTGAADAFSDIDLRVIVEPGSHKRFVADRLKMPESWGRLMFNEWVPGTTHCVSHFRPFGKIDIFYIAADALAPSPWLALPTRILHDPRGLLADVIARSQYLKFEVAPDAIERVIGKGLASAHEAVRRLCRGELCHSQALLEELRTWMAHLDDLLKGRAPQAVVFTRFEKRASKALLNTFAASYVSLDPVQIERALLDLAAIFRTQMLTAHDQFGLSYRRDRDLHAIDIVLKREIK
ncbi:MAG: nucleotidyltransferase domain-containing protein [Phycisphaerales bacterium]|nr:nucleotidyltransferase domain-containing protein [Phycisphaerales bacterium]